MGIYTWIGKCTVTSRVADQRSVLKIQIVEPTRNKTINLLTTDVDENIDFQSKVFRSVNFEIPTDFY